MNMYIQINKHIHKYKYIYKNTETYSKNYIKNTYTKIC